MRPNGGYLHYSLLQKCIVKIELCWEKYKLNTGKWYVNIADTVIRGCPLSEPTVRVVVSYRGTQHWVYVNIQNKFRSCHSCIHCPVGRVIVHLLLWYISVIVMFVNYKLSDHEITPGHCDSYTYSALLSSLTITLPSSPIDRLPLVLSTNINCVLKGL